MQVTGGDTNVTTYFMMRLTTDGTAATGLTITTFDLQYTRTGAAPATKVDATALALTSTAHTDNKMIEVDSTSSPGLYRVDWPDAAFAVGVTQVHLNLKYDSTVFAESMVVDIDAPANTTRVSGTAQTAGDIIGEIGTAGAGLTDLGGMSTGMKAEINTEVDTGLTDYDAPTNTELTARTLASAAYFDFTTDTVDVGAINGSTLAATQLALSAGTIVAASAITGTLTTTTMTTDLTEATDDHYNGRIIIWTSGVLINQATNITDYTGSTKLLTYTATTEAPSNTDTFVIV